ncbi:MAG: hypothetical protein RMI56_03650 [Sulfolobales archaeon]|nr:hypothetical protein [Sulfolobales archaeon]MDW8082876.1 hypothetical protein [Sulfolobales archaeon]
MKKFGVVFAVLLVVLSQVSSIALLATPSSLFSIEEVSFRSSVGGDVYPGSSSARLAIGVRYLGSETARLTTGCLKLPPGFSARYLCSGARGIDGLYATSVEYGEVVYFEYVVNVDKAVFPGIYLITLNVSSRVSTSVISEVLVFSVEVSRYPDLEVEFLNTYWSPEAYPGTSETTLFLVFKLGRTGIRSALVRVELPDGFYPRTIKRNLGAVSRQSMFTVSVSGVNIDKKLNPGVYRVSVAIEAETVTDDGVVHEASASFQVSVEVGSPPVVQLRVVSSGWRESRAPSGSRSLEYSVLVRSEDPSTISSLIAELKLPECAESINGSRTIVTYLNRPVSYGEVFELVFSDISLACSSTELASLVLEILAVRDGSEFWVTQVYRVPIVVQNPSIDIRVVSTYWSPGPAYPGSSELSLVLVVENYDYVSLYDGVVKLLLDVVEPRETTLSGFSVESLSRATLVFRGLSIPRSTAPGAYSLKLTVNSLARSGRAVYIFLLEVYLSINVSDPPQPRLEVVSYGWVDGKAFSQSIGNSMRIFIRNSDPSIVVRSLRATLELPDCFSVDNLRKTFVSSATLPYGSTVTLEYPEIGITCSAGIYLSTLSVEVLGEISGATFWQNLMYNLAIDVEAPTLNVVIADAGWTSGIAYRNSSRLIPYVILTSYTRDTLLHTYIRVKPLNARLSGGGIESTVSTRESISYGSSLTVRLPALEAEGVEDAVEIELYVEAVIRYGDTIYNASKRLKVRIPVVSERNLAISRFQIEYGGAPSPLLPTARDVRLAVLLTNVRPEPVSISGVHVEAPRGFRILGVGGDCSRVTLTSGGTCGLDIVLHVQEDVEPSTYIIQIGVEYIKQVSGVVLYSSERLSIPVAVDSLENYVPEVRVLRAFWGLQQPSPAFSGSRYVPVTVVLQNIGRYDAVGLTVRARSVNLNPVVNIAECSVRLPPGSYCSAVLYFDIPSSVGGYIAFDVVLEYYVAVFGTHARVSRQHTNQLYIESTALFGGSLKPVSWGWLNNYNVFPETENSTFVITVANRLPYSVVGVLAELYLPRGFRGSRGGVSTAYLDGPLRSYSTASISFRVSVGRVEPGSYRAIVRLDYIVQSGGPGDRLVEEHEVEIAVVDDRESVELISAGWVEGSVEPGTYGALLHVVVRNRFVDGMAGVFLELALPTGVFSSIDNSSTIKVPPISQQILQGVLSAGTPQLSILTQLLRPAVPSSPFSRGSMIDFLVPLNVLVNTTGSYTADAVIHYIDSWGTPRRCEFRLPLAVLGSVRYVDVYIDGGTVRVSSRFTEAVLKIRNIGSSPAYNVYIAVFPYAQLPVVLASPSVHYIDRLDPDREAQIVLTLAYNPMGVFAGGTQSVISYGTVPLIIGVVYRDVGGRLKTFNTSTVVVVEPFVDLTLRDLKATIVTDTLRVSGVLVNYGSASAYRAGARVCLSGGRCAESFIGDVESGAQRAFSVTMSAVPLLDVVRLTIYYYNVYNELQHIEFSVSVTVTTTPTQTTTPVENQYTIERWIIIATVAGFLVGVAYLIYRVVASYNRKLKAISRVPPP